MNNKELALEKTKKKFTNLMDGKVHNASVAQIISYYESCLISEKAEVRASSGIINNFFEEFVSEIEKEYEQ
jgi:hypothetical protein